MVGTEENSSNDVAAARDRLIAAMSPAALEALAGFAPWAKPKPDMSYASSASVEQNAYGAAEPATAAAFLRDDQAPTQPAGTGSILTLVADNDEDVVTEADAQKLIEAITLLCMAAGVSPAEISELADRAKGSVGCSKSTLESIRSVVMSEATVLASHAAGKAAESAEEKRTEAWKRIEELNKEISDDLYELRTPEERARAAELEKELKRRKDEEERVLADPNSTEAQKKAAMQARIEALGAIDVNDKRDAVRIERSPNTTPDELRKVKDVNGKIDDRHTLYEEEAKRLDSTKTLGPEKNNVDKSLNGSTIISKNEINHSPFAVISVVEFPTDSPNGKALPIQEIERLKVTEATLGDATSKAVPFAVATATPAVNLRGG